MKQGIQNCDVPGDVGNAHGGSQLDGNVSKFGLSAVALQDHKHGFS